jgi:hypothetical protein
LQSGKQSEVVAVAGVVGAVADVDHVLPDVDVVEPPVVNLGKQKNLAKTQKKHEPAEGGGERKPTQHRMLDRLEVNVDEEAKLGPAKLCQNRDQTHYFFHIFNLLFFGAFMSNCMNKSQMTRGYQ